MRSCWKLSPSPVEPVPAGFRMDVLLAKAEPLNDCGSAFGITDLSREEKTYTTAAAERSENK